jgi:hypothetical protein
MRLELSQSSPEVRASMIEAVARVYAAGLVAAGSTCKTIRRREAKGDVDDFLAKLSELGAG